MKKTQHCIRYLNLFRLAVLVACALPRLGHSLALDEKLTLRLLKVSDSKKTVLVNRGIEDGLATGDHAKFYLTSGMVARGVVVKVSPARSIWSFYRVIDPDKVVPDAVMNLKIATAVKLTEDGSRALQEERTRTSSPTDSSGIPLAPGANNLDELTDIEENDLKALESNNASSKGDLRGRLWEIWGMAQFNALESQGSASTAGRPNASFDTEGENSIYGLSLGVEKYFWAPGSWYGNLSFSPFLQYLKQELTNVSGQKVDLGTIEFGVSGSWHFYNMPHDMRKLIGFATGSFGGGRIAEYSVQNTNTVQGGATNVTEVRYDGVETFYSLGVGLKYYLAEAIGGRAIFDYFNREEEFGADDTGTSFSRQTGGFRLYFGLAYRW